MKTKHQESCPVCGAELHHKITIVYTPSAEMLTLMSKIITGLKDIAWNLSKVPEQWREY